MIKIGKRIKQFYKYGSYRNELCSYLIGLGTISNSSFKVLCQDQNELTKQNIYISRFIKEGLIQRINFEANGRKYRLFKFNNTSELNENIRTMFSEEEYNYYQNNIRRTQYFSESRAKYELLREVRRSETGLLMIASGVRTLPNDFSKEEILKGSEKLEEDISCFIFYDEIKKSIGNISENDVKLNSRAIGILFTPKKRYTVYNAGNKRLTYSPQIEWSTEDIGIVADFKYRPAGFKNENKREAILIAEESTIENMLLDFTSDKQQIYKNMKAGKTDNTYEHMYWIPNSKEGALFLSELLEDDFKAKIKERLSAGYDKPRNTWLKHHATRGSTFVYYFCDSDINDFYDFLMQYENVKEKIDVEIVCYPFQEDLVKRVADSVTVTVIEL